MYCSIYLGKHDFGNIFTFNDVMNIQDGIAKVFGSRKIAYSMVLNDFFGITLTNIPHAIPNY